MNSPIRQPPNTEVTIRETSFMLSLGNTANSSAPAIISAAASGRGQPGGAQIEAVAAPARQKRLQQIHHCDRGDGVQAGIERRHGRGDDRRDHQTGHAGRDVAEDEVREHLVGFESRRQFVPGKPDRTRTDWCPRKRKTPTSARRSPSR
jgi:hypothetical protein